VFFFRFRSEYIDCALSNESELGIKPNANVVEVNGAFRNLILGKYNKNNVRVNTGRGMLSEY
jgi:hypothetical protein